MIQRRLKIMAASGELPVGLDLVTYRCRNRFQSSQ